MKNKKISILLYLFFLQISITACEFEQLSDKDLLERFFQDIPISGLRNKEEALKLLPIIAKKGLINSFRNDNFSESLLNPTPLIHSLTYYVDDEFVKKLIEYGADPNIQDSKTCNTALMAVITQYIIPLNIFKLLLNAKADVNLKNKIGKTALIFAAERTGNEGAFEVINLLLQNEADINAKDNEGNTALIYSINEKNKATEFRVANLLLDKGANVNIVNNEGETALRKAVSQSNLRLVQKILSSNEFNHELIDLKPKKSQYSTLDIAFIRATVRSSTYDLYKKQAKEIVKLLIKTKLNYLLNTKKISSVKEILEQFVSSEYAKDWNIKEFVLNSLLLHFIREKNYKIINDLINEGADISFKDEFGTTILNQIILTGEPKLVENILKNAKSPIQKEKLFNLFTSKSKDNPIKFAKYAARECSPKEEYEKIIKFLKDEFLNYLTTGEEFPGMFE